MLLPYGLARPFLFGLDAEVAHELTLGSLAKIQRTPLAWPALGHAAHRVQDPVEVAGLPFPNRVGLAAGLDKNALCIDAFAAMGFGFIEVGTVTPLPQAGNPKPRMFRLPQAQALVNRLGFNNGGLAAFVANVQKSSVRQPGCKHPVLLGLNIGKNAGTPIERAVDDYLLCLDAVFPHADYITINISSPNTKNLRALQSDDALDELLGTLAERAAQLTQRLRRRVPLFVKIAPDLDEDQIAAIAHTLKRYGCNGKGKPNQSWGVVATNTTVSRAGVAGLQHADETGGLSGSPLLSQSNAVVRQLRELLGAGFPIIGVGGILSAQDAVSKIKAGADVVQIYTGLIYQGPKLVNLAANMIKNSF
ncbi:MAG: quinone-dependent dihydroorotate dehydrogenase [Burkholderiaceae bacterium]